MAANERKTWAVVALTSAMMIGEIVGGLLFGSVALVADGLHMSTHAVGYEALARLLHPGPIAFMEALPIAALGLLINLASAFLLHADEDHLDEHAAHHHDLNLRAAYVHVLADAVTSLLAIVALSLGWLFGWTWTDPLAGLAGALVIANWSWGLVRQAGSVLLDATPDQELVGRIRREIETNGDKISDLHLWRIGPGHLGAIISLVSHRPQSPAAYKARLAGLGGLSHVTVEVEACH